MAYNRDWDRGKEAWGDPSAWNDGGNWNQGARGARGREEDYYNEGKRRKYNDGGYQGYGAQQYQQPYNEGWEGASGSAYGQARQQEHSQDYSGDDRGHRGAAGGGFGNKKRMAASEPSPHVIFLGLDPDFTEADLQSFLVRNSCTIETVTIIRERSSGASKGFGFAQFPTTEHARAFVDPLFPFVQIPPPASHGASATAAFYKALEMGTPHNGRRVKIDYSQSNQPHDKGRGRQNMNDGTRDIGNTQSTVLLFRGLDALSGPQAINQAMRLSSGVGKEGAKGMKRIILIKDKVTLASFGFAFVEFVDAQSASAVLAATMSPQIHPNGFRISDKPVAASFAHPYSFQPVTDFMLRDDSYIASSAGLGGGEGQWVKYWDESSTIALLEFEVDAPQAEAAAPAEKKKEKKKAKDAVVSAGPSAPAEASALPVSDKPVTFSFNKGGTNSKTLANATVSAPAKATAAAPLVGFSEEPAEDSGAGDEDIKNEGLRLTTGKKVAPLIASQKTVKNINKWNQVQEELKHPSESAAAAATPALATPAAVPKVQPAAVKAKAKEASTTPVPMEAEFEFSDLDKKTCLLCSRQFKSLDQLKRHNNESDLHKKNFKDVSLREVAKQKVVAAKEGASQANKAEQPKYRDRASERRTMHNQPDAPLPEQGFNGANKNIRRAEGPPPPPSPPPPPVNPGKDETNIGNKMLKMMGWTEGSGLGTSGDGRIDPIETAIYAQGAGLGASKGKEIGKSTVGLSFADSVREAARDRYKA